MGRLRTLLFTTLLLTAVLPQGIAQQKYPTPLHIDMQVMEKAGAPQQRGDFVLFSYSANHPVMRVGIAFAHDNFNKIHTFFRNENGVFLYPYTPPEDADRLIYRIVVDGMWMADPENPRTMTTPEDVTLSYFELPRKREEPQRMEIPKAGKVTFTYRSTDARRISLAGSFNRWDPYMYRLKRVEGSKNLYSITLPLPEGTHYYYFIVDGARKTDPNNPDRMVDSMGNTVSVIEVPG